MARAGDEVGAARALSRAASLASKEVGVGSAGSGRAGAGGSGVLAGTVTGVTGDVAIEASKVIAIQQI